MGRRRVHRPDAGSEPVLMQNNLPPLCDAERRFFVCSAPTGPGLQISGLRRFRCIVRPFRRRTAIRLFRRSAAGDIHGEIKAGQVGFGRVQAVVRGTDADVARSDVQRRGLQPLIAIRDRSRSQARPCPPRRSAACSRSGSRRLRRKWSARRFRSSAAARR